MRFRSLRMEKERDDSKALGSSFFDPRKKIIDTRII
jgi:hypothetical protein